MKRIVTLAFIFLIIFTNHLFASELNEYALQELKDLNEYSSKAPYTKAIDGVFIGYSQDGKALKGVGFREFKSYEVITAMLVISFVDGKYVVEKADVPDIEKIKNDKKRSKVQDVIGRFTGTVIKEKDAKVQTVDAISGATRYSKRIYGTLNLLAKTLVKEMENPPSWEKIKL